MPLRPDRDVAFFNALGRDHLPELLGVVITDLTEGYIRAELPLRKALFAPNGYLHAGTVVAFADTAAGYACYAHLPPESNNFTTLELKTNLMGTAREGSLVCESRGVHLGRTTQVWDATVSTAEGKQPIALFRCTQMILYPK